MKIINNIYVLYSGPGSGKGTQAELLKEDGYIHLSTGVFYRNQKRLKTEIGKLVIEYADKGNLLPDDITNRAMDNEIIRLSMKHKDSKGLIIDGYPRTLSQAKQLDNTLKSLKTELRGVIYLDVDEEVLTQRLLERGEKSGREDDKNIDTINKRMRIFKDTTEVIEKYYSNNDKLIKINGARGVSDVNINILGEIEKRK